MWWENFILLAKNFVCLFHRLNVSVVEIGFCEFYERVGRLTAILSSFRFRIEFS